MPPVADENPAAPAAPAVKPGVWRRFGAAMGYPFHGMRLVFQHPRLLLLCAGPVLTAVVVSLLLFTGAISLGQRLAHRTGHGFFAELFFLFFVVFVFVAIGYFAYVALISIAAAPFCSAISDRVEAIHTGVTLPPQPFSTTLREAGRGVLHAIARAFVYLLISLPLSLFNMIFPPLAPVILCGQFVVTSYFLAYDFLDYPLSRRCAGFGQKWKFIDEHRAESLGFGFMLGLIFLFPVINVLMAPFAAAGAAILHADLRAGSVIKP